MTERQEEPDWSRVASVLIAVAAAGAPTGIARREMIRLKEASVSLERLQSADEVFVTGSGVGVLAIGSVDGHRYEVARPLTPRIRTEYEALLDRESAW